MPIKRNPKEDSQFSLEESRDGSGNKFRKLSKFDDLRLNPETLSLMCI